MGVRKIKINSRSLTGDTIQFKIQLGEQLAPIDQSEIIERKFVETGVKESINPIDDKIKYQFVPQAFTDLYIKAWNDQSEQYCLVIEEINRDGQRTSYSGFSEEVPAPVVAEEVDVLIVGPGPDQNGLPIIGRLDSFLNRIEGMVPRTVLIRVAAGRVARRRIAQGIVVHIDTQRSGRERGVKRSIGLQNAIHKGSIRVRQGAAFDEITTPSGKTISGVGNRHRPNASTVPTREHPLAGNND